MNNDQFSGTARSLGGDIEKAAGDLTNDHSMQADGVIDQAKGAAQKLYGNAKDAVHNVYDRAAPATRDSIGRAVEVTRQNSLLAMLAAGAVGFALAVALRGENSNSRDTWPA